MEESFLVDQKPYGLKLLGSGVPAEKVLYSLNNNKVNFIVRTR